MERVPFQEPRGQLFGKLHPFGTDLFFGFYQSAHIVGGVAVQIVWGPPPSPGQPTPQRAITLQKRSQIRTLKSSVTLMAT